MRTLFDTLATQWRRPPAQLLPGSAPAAVIAPQRGTRRYRCRCGKPIFFRNSACTNCGWALGYIAETGQVRALDPGPVAGLWLLADEPPPRRMYQRCSNFLTAAGCNWLVALDSTEPAKGGAAAAAPAAPAAAPPPMLCRACRLNRTIPDLSDPVAAELWRRMELARRRLISQLILIGLPVASRVPAAHEDPERGLMFDMLGSMPGGPKVMTGHEAGLITLSLDEADDATRERIRVEMREPYRTLLGHFRHEVGHYYWDRLVDGTAWIDGYRALFGDERADYTAALEQHYASGPAPDWALRHVSSYASTHSWEDWAETWAHYLHMLDTLDTALSYGIEADHVEFDADPFTREDLWRPDDPGAGEFLGFVNGWVELTAVLNELSRSMGQPDYYPFVLPRPVVAKLQLVHLVVQEARAQQGVKRPAALGAATGSGEVKPAGTATTSPSAAVAG